MGKVIESEKKCHISLEEQHYGERWGDVVISFFS